MKTAAIRHLRLARIPALLAALALPLGATEEAAPRPRIEVCFLLDTTGSMSGLIEGAKQKIWSIANEMASAKPAPEIRFALVAYRDRGDDYVVRHFPLTDDLDEIHAQLMKFEAGGGGDTPESVNEALATAVRKTEWSGDRDALKVIFLVGDAPPHMDYQGEPQYPEICAEAVRRDIIINTIQCGGIPETTPVWKEIAKLAEGEFAALEQSGGMQVVETPYDADLARLNRAIGATLLPYGSERARSAVLAKQALAESAPAPAAADRLVYNLKAGKAVQGEGELLDAIRSGRVSLESLGPDDLPKDLRGLSKDELKKEIESRRAEREKLQAEIAALAARREAYIKEESAKRSRENERDSFDKKVSDTIKKQGAKKGLTY